MRIRAVRAEVLRGRPTLLRSNFQFSICFGIISSHVRALCTLSIGISLVIPPVLCVPHTLLCRESDRQCSSSTLFVSPVSFLSCRARTVGGGDTYHPCCTVVFLSAPCPGDVVLSGPPCPPPRDFYVKHLISFLNFQPRHLLCAGSVVCGPLVPFGDLWACGAVVRVL